MIRWHMETAAWWLLLTGIFVAWAAAVTVMFVADVLGGRDE